MYVYYSTSMIVSTSSFSLELKAVLVGMKRSLLTTLTTKNVPLVNKSVLIKVAMMVVSYYYDEEGG